MICAAAILLVHPGSLHAQSPDLAAAEYFIDIDPGHGLGIAIPGIPSDTSATVPFVVPTGGLSIGLHTLHVRFRDADGNWSMIESRVFYIREEAPVSVVSAIEEVEYFLKEDPGHGLGTGFAGSAGDTVEIAEQISAGALPPGLHTLHVRARNEAGGWSTTESRVFYIREEASVPVVSAIEEIEYFVDDDPGHGLGTGFAGSAGDTVEIAEQISAGALPPGLHTLHVRARSDVGGWSTTESRVFYLFPPPDVPAPSPLVRLEYFFNIDPGLGAGVEIPIFPAGLVHVTSGLATTGLELDSTHTVTVRVQNANGLWSMGTWRSFTIEGGINDPPVVANPIPDQELDTGDPPFVLDLNAPDSIFTDPNGDVLVYWASSSTPSVALPSISGSTLEVAALLGGSATITVGAGDGNSGTVQTSFAVTVTGTIGEPDIEVAPPVKLDFGDIVKGGTSTRGVRVSNVGNTDLRVADIALVGSAQFRRTDGAGASFMLPPGASKTLTVKFAPDATGPFIGALTITSDDPDERSLVLIFRGNGIEGGGTEVRLPRRIAHPGQILLVPLHIDVFGADWVTASSCEIVVTYDSRVVRAHEPARIGTLAEEWLVEHRIAQGAATPIDTIEIALATSMDTLSTGTLFYIRGIASEYASTGDSSALTFETCRFDEGAIVVQTVDGMVAIGSVPGDLTGNGDISAFDASLILQNVVGLITVPTPHWPAFILDAADVTGDGTISALDASWILRYAAGLVTQFPVEEDAGAAKTTYAERRIRLGDLDELPADRWVVPVEIDDMDGVLAGEIEMSFDDARAVEVRTTDLTSAYLSAVNIGEDHLRVSFAGVESSDGAGRILEVVLEGPPALSIDRVRLNEGEIPVRIVDGHVKIPRAYSLSQNCPNPFNPETSIGYDIAKAGTVRLTVHALTGQQIRTLVDAERPAGSYQVTWDGADHVGREVASGVYLCRMQVGDYRAVRKMLLIR